MDTTTEFRYAELRHDGERSISGTILRYGDEAEIGGMFRERIDRDAFRFGDTILNLQHNRSKPLAREGSGLVITKGAKAIELRAEIVKTATGDEALTLIGANIVRGVSVEMHVQRDEWRDRGRLRIVQEARVTGVALVDRPAYPHSSVDRWKVQEARAGRSRRLAV